MGSGQTKTALEEKEYSFKTADSHGINWSKKKVYLITTQESAQEAEQFCKKYNTLYIDCKGHNFGTVKAAIGLIQIAVSEDICILFDVVQCSDGFRVIKKLMESTDTRKVFHDSSEAVAALKLVRFAEISGIYVKNLYDTQVGQRVIDIYRTDNVNKDYRLRELYEHVVGKVFPEVEVNSSEDRKWLEERPLSEDMIKCSAVDAVVLSEIYESQRNQTAAKLIEDVNKEMHSKQKQLVSDIATDTDISDCVIEESKLLLSQSAPDPAEEPLYDTYREHEIPSSLSVAVEKSIDHCPPIPQNMVSALTGEAPGEKSICTVGRVQSNVLTTSAIVVNEKPIYIGPPKSESKVLSPYAPAATAKSISKDRHANKSETLPPSGTISDVKPIYNWPPKQQREVLSTNSPSSAVKQIYTGRLVHKSEELRPSTTFPYWKPIYDDTTTHGSNLSLTPLVPAQKSICTDDRVQSEVLPTSTTVVDVRPTYNGPPKNESKVLSRYSPSLDVKPIYSGSPKNESKVLSPYARAVDVKPVYSGPPKNESKVLSPYAPAATAKSICKDRHSDKSETVSPSAAFADVKPTYNWPSKHQREVLSTNSPASAEKPLFYWSSYKREEHIPCGTFADVKPIYNDTAKLGSKLSPFTGLVLNDKSICTDDHVQSEVLPTSARVVDVKPIYNGLPKNENKVLSPYAPSATAKPISKDRHADKSETLPPSATISDVKPIYNWLPTHQDEILSNSPASAEKPIFFFTGFPIQKSEELKPSGTFADMKPTPHSPVSTARQVCTVHPVHKSEVLEPSTTVAEVEPIKELPPKHENQVLSLCTPAPGEKSIGNEHPVHKSEDLPVSAVAADVKPLYANRPKDENRATPLTDAIPAENSINTGCCKKLNAHDTPTHTNRSKARRMKQERSTSAPAKESVYVGSSQKSIQTSRLVNEMHLPQPFAQISAPDTGSSVSKLQIPPPAPFPKNT